MIMFHISSPTLGFVIVKQQERHNSSNCDEEYHTKNYQRPNEEDTMNGGVCEENRTNAQH